MEHFHLHLDFFSKEVAWQFPLLSDLRWSIPPTALAEGSFRSEEEVSLRLLYTKRKLLLISTQKLQTQKHI